MYPLSILRESIKVFRKTGGAYGDNGRWIEGNEQTLIHKRTSVQPMDSKELQMLPEGERSDGAVNVFDIEELKSAIEGTSQEADEIEWQGRRYKIIKVDSWIVGRLNHYHAQAVLVRN